MSSEAQYAPVVSQTDPKITVEDNVNFMAPFATGKFWMALFQMQPDKSQGQPSFSDSGPLLVMMWLEIALHG